jgi:murein DD-endopeptidase MepM/ murein hydrolase activator NlpD
MKKRERHLSVIIVPHHRGRQWSCDVSYTALRWLVAGLGVLVLAVAFLIVSYGKIYWRAGQYELMRTRQAAMEAEFAKLQQYRAELTKIRTTESKVRQILGVPKQPDTLTAAEMARSAGPGTRIASESVGGQTPVNAGSQRSTPSLMPTRGWISSGLNAEHRGVDIAARLDQPVLATADGIVVFAGWDSYYGNKVEIHHDERFTTIYGHCAKILVKQGQPVKKGQMIALVGSSGKSTGPHLHYEMMAGGKIVDPSIYWINQ